MAGAGAHPHPPQPAVRRRPRAFRVVVVADGAVLTEGADTRATIDLLTGIDSIFDVVIFVWHPPARGWRRLTLGEQRTLWDFRGR